jgi:hypothetical protein
MLAAPWLAFWSRSWHAEAERLQPPAIAQKIAELAFRQRAGQAGQ